MVITWMQIFNNKKPCEFLTQVTEYVSPDMLLYDDKILHFWKVFAWMVQFSILLLFHNVRMPCTYYKKHALLHYVSLTCGRMQMYPGQMYYPQLIEPSATELYYTMSVWHVEECRCTQVRCTPQSNLVVQNPTILCQFDMWKNAGTTQVKCTPPANWTKCYRALLHNVSFTCGKWQM